MYSGPVRSPATGVAPVSDPTQGVLRVPVLVGSVRRGRKSIGVARFACDRLERAGSRAPLLDLAALDLPVMEERVHMRDDAPAGALRLSRSIESADAVVVVSPEYNGSIPGALKNAMDYLLGEWHRKPVGIVTVSSGAFGGVQVHNHLQLLFLRLKALPVAGMAVSHVGRSFGADGELLEARYEKSFAAFSDTLCWYARAIAQATAREGVAPRRA